MKMIKKILRSHDENLVEPILSSANISPTSVQTILLGLFYLFTDLVI